MNNATNQAAMPKIVNTMGDTTQTTASRASSLAAGSARTDVDGALNTVNKVMQRS
jgi:hypothetical protein